MQVMCFRIEVISLAHLIPLKQLLTIKIMTPYLLDYGTPASAPYLKYRI